MTKSEIIELLARRRNLPRKTAEEIVAVVFDGMVRTMMDGGRIEIRGFGSFKVKQYKGYLGRNPKTTRQILVAPKRLPFWKVSPLLQAQLNRGLLEG